MIFDCDGREQIIGLLDLFYQELGRNAVVLSDTQTKVISASCGFALADDIHNNIAELLRCADEALYEVKRGIKGTYGEYQN